MSEKQILTNSSLSTFKSCPRKYQLRYELGYLPVREGEYLTFGKMMHKGIEVLAQTKDISAARQAIHEMMNLSPERDDYMLAKVIALIEGYEERYRADSFKTVAAEQEFRAPVMNPETARVSMLFELGGVMDQIVMDGSGQYLIKETKTTGESIEDPTSDYWMNLAIDSQISTYFIGMQALGLEADRCLYDVIRKPTIRPKQVGKEIDPVNPKREERPEEYYARLRADIAFRPNLYYARKEVPRLKNDLEDFLFDLWYTAQTIRDYQTKNKWPRNTRACLGMYGTCPYFGVCTGRDSLEDPTLFKKADRKHQELAPVEAA